MKRFTLKDAAAVLRAPTAVDSKYTRGVVGLLTGSEKYPGAAVLSAMGADRCGAGYVRYVGPHRCEDLVLQRCPEVVLGEGRCDAWVMGPGVANSVKDARHGAMSHLLAAAGSEQAADAAASPACVVDAGALDELTPGGTYKWTVITPHIGELARLLQSAGVIDATEDAIRSDRAAWALRARDLFGCAVVLKCAHTLIVPAPEVAADRPTVDQRTAGQNTAEQHPGRTRTTGHVGGNRPSPIRENRVLQVIAPTYWLASAGTGDVLAGVLGGVLAQLRPRLLNGNVDFASAIASAVLVHGVAGGFASGVLDPEQPLRAESALMGMAADTAIVGRPLTASQVAEQVPTAIHAVLAAESSTPAASFRSRPVFRGSLH